MYASGKKKMNTGEILFWALFCLFNNNSAVGDGNLANSTPTIQNKSRVLKMLLTPRARLLQFPDHWGEFEDYRFSTRQDGGMCSDLNKLKGRVKSVVTFGKCVRLFEKQFCDDWSVAVYPESPNSHRLELPPHVRIKAIGPCLGNEFSGGFLNQSMPRFVVKNPELSSYQPDLARMFDPHIKLGRTKRFGALLVKYLLGHGNRTEIIQADFLLKHKLSPTVSLNKLAFDKSLEIEDRDVIGQAIPMSHGGPACGFNVFPAHRFAVEKWHGIFLPYTRPNKKIAELVLHFEYENVSKTRPLFFYYWIYDSDYEIEYGRILNGNQTDQRREEPYIKVIPKFEYKGTQKIKLSQVLEANRGILMQFLSRTTSLHNLNQIRDTTTTVSNWQRCKQINVRSDIDFKENVTQPFILKTQIREMVKNPMVRLFSGENLTGESEEYHSGRDIKSCNDRETPSIIKSAETFGKCIRLFEGENCKGRSLAVYGRRENSHRTVDTILNQVLSLGPCLEEEFMDATLIDGENGFIAKKNQFSRSYVPDLLIYFVGFPPNRTLAFDRKSVSLGPIDYGLGPKSRIEYIYTKIRQVGPAQIPKIFNVEETEFYKSIHKIDGDVPCYAIPLELNGPGNETFNIFPISLCKVDDWTIVFPSISDADDLLEYDTQLRFVYEDDKTTRPPFIYYHFNYLSEYLDYYGRFQNL